MTKKQLCSTDGCGNAAAYTTRTRPAFCEPCIDGFFRQGGMEPVEPFAGTRAWRLARCLTCGKLTHCRFETVLDKNRVGERVCRACYWTRWAEEDREGEWNEFHRVMLGALLGLTPDELLAGLTGTGLEEMAEEWLKTRWWPEERIVAHLDKMHFDLVDLLNDVHDGNDPVITRCRACGRVQAQRMGDVGFGCDCSKNNRSSNPRTPVMGRERFADSSLGALGWWDHDANSERSFRSLTVRSGKECHWVCPDCGHRFVAGMGDMALSPACPECRARECAAQEAERERLKVTPVSQHPELAAAWADEADPSTVMVTDERWTKYRLRCPRGHCFAASLRVYLDRGCPSCQAAATREANKKDANLAVLLPEVASQWHPTKNGRPTPTNVPWDSRRKVWWYADCCDHEWQETVRSRDKYQRLRCPLCRSILGSLAYVHPGLAAEWHPDNPVSAWHVRPHASKILPPRWVCAKDPTHVWEMALTTRVNGGGCPDCRQVGKSTFELAHHEAAEALFGAARSGVAVKHEAFVAQRSWTIDILVETTDRKVAVEYDGAYWHSPDAKVLVDETKSRDLLAAGYWVVRLREDDLPALPIEHERYHEVRVYSVAPRPVETMRAVQALVTP